MSLGTTGQLVDGTTPYLYLSGSPFANFGSGLPLQEVKDAGALSYAATILQPIIPIGEPDAAPTGSTYTANHSYTGGFEVQYVFQRTPWTNQLMTGWHTQVVTGVTN